MKDKKKDYIFDLEQLLHPANAFKHPSRVISDPDLTLSEKRAILSSWASDACAHQAAPELRERQAALFDDIIDALRSLDSGDGQPVKKFHKLAIRRAILRLRCEARPIK
jgi:hypothetical protein